MYEGKFLLDSAVVVVVVVVVVVDVVGGSGPIGTSGGGQVFKPLSCFFSQLVNWETSA